MPATFRFVFEDESAKAPAGGSSSAPSGGGGGSSASAGGGSRSGGGTPAGAGSKADDPLLKLANELGKLPYIGGPIRAATGVAESLMRAFGAAGGGPAGGAAGMAAPANPFLGMGGAMGTAALKTAASGTAGQSATPFLGMGGAMGRAAASTAAANLGGGAAAGTAGAAAAGAGGAAAAGGLMAAGGGALAVLGPIAIVGVAVAGALKLAADAASAFASRVTARAQELEAFSPDIARAKAQNEIADVRANFRAGREFGADYAEFSRVTSNISRDLRYLGDIINTTLLDEIRPLLNAVEKLTDLAEKYPEEARAIVDHGLAAILNAISGGTGETVLKGVNGILKLVGLAEEQANRESQDLNIFEDFNKLPDLDLAEGQLVGGLGRKAVRFNAVGGMELP